MVGIEKLPKAFSVPFRDLTSWNVGAQFKAKWGWPSEVLRPLGDVLVRRIDPLENNTTSNFFVTLLTIRFDGSIEPRTPVTRKKIKGKLFKVFPGDVVFSKIDVRNGAIALVPEGIENCCVTSEFPVYSVKTELSVPRYIKLLFRTKVFMRILNSMISGASGRKRIQPSQLEEVKVPIPPLSVQQKIMAYWRAAVASICEADISMEETRSKAFNSFRNGLGLSATISVNRPRLFTANWSQIDRWGIGLVWRNKNNTDSFAYSTKPLRAICKTGSGGTPSRKHKEYFGGKILWVKTTEVKNNVINDTEEKITPLGLASSSAKVYPTGSIVMAMYGQGATRGRTAKLGAEASTNQACLVITEIDESLDTDFLWYYLMVSYEAMRSLASGNNQPNLSAELIGGFPVPIPPKEKQNELKELFEKAQIEVSSLQSHKDEIRERAVKEIERMILGLHPLEGI
jgi:type I restriction enzyme S subunit